MRCATSPSTANHAHPPSDLSFHAVLHRRGLLSLTAVCTHHTTCFAYSVSIQSVSIRVRRQSCPPPKTPHAKSLLRHESSVCFLRLLHSSLALQVSDDTHGSTCMVHAFQPVAVVSSSDWYFLNSLGRGKNCCATQCEK